MYVGVIDYIIGLHRNLCNSILSMEQELDSLDLVQGRQCCVVTGCVLGPGLKAGNDTENNCFRSTCIGLGLSSN